MTICHAAPPFTPLVSVWALDYAGYGAPEGLHQDGHYYATTVLGNRVNVDGGESVFADLNWVAFWQKSLREPLEAVLWRDAWCWHDVTPIIPLDMTRSAARDIIGISWNPVRAD